MLLSLNSSFLWRNANILGLRKENILKKTKDLILDLKVLPFTKVNNVDIRY